MAAGISKRLRSRIRLWADAGSEGVQRVHLEKTMGDSEFQVELTADFLSSVDASDPDHDMIVAFFGAVEQRRSRFALAVPSETPRIPLIGTSEIEQLPGWAERSKTEHVSGSRVRTSDPQKTPTMETHPPSEDELVKLEDAPSIEDQPDPKLRPEELGREIEKTIARTEAPTRLDNEILSDAVVGDVPPPTPPHIRKRAAVVDMPAVAAVDDDSADDAVGGTKANWNPKVSAPPVSPSRAPVSFDSELAHVRKAVPDDESEADKLDAVRAQELAELDDSEEVSSVAPKAPLAEDEIEALLTKHEEEMRADKPSVIVDDSAFEDDPPVDSSEAQTVETDLPEGALDEPVMTPSDDDSVDGEENVTSAPPPEADDSDDDSDDDSSKRDRYDTDARKFFKDGDNGHSADSDSSEQPVDSLGPVTTPGVSPAPVLDDSDFGDRFVRNGRRKTAGITFLVIAAAVIFLVVVPLLVKKSGDIEVRHLEEDVVSEQTTTKEAVADTSKTDKPEQKEDLGPKLDLSPLPAKVAVTEKPSVKERAALPAEPVVEKAVAKEEAVIPEKPVAEEAVVKEEAVRPAEPVASGKLEEGAASTVTETSDVVKQETVPVSEKVVSDVDTAALAASIKAEILADLGPGLATEKSVDDLEQHIQGRINQLLESRLTKQDVLAVVEPVAAQVSQLSESVANTDNQVDEQAIVKRVYDRVMARVEDFSSTGLSKDEIARNVSGVARRLLLLEQNTQSKPVIDENGLAERVYGMVVADLHGLEMRQQDDQPPVIVSMPKRELPTDGRKDYSQLPSDPREDYRRAPGRFGKQLAPESKGITVGSIRNLPMFAGKSDADLAEYVKDYNSVFELE